MLQIATFKLIFLFLANPSWVWNQMKTCRGVEFTLVHGEFLIVALRKSMSEFCLSFSPFEFFDHTR